MSICLEVTLLTLLLVAGISAHIQQHASDTETEAINRRLADENGELMLLCKKGNFPEQWHATPRQEIYFNAGLSAHTTVTGGHTVIFDSVVENVGDGYNKYTGIFRAPVKGMYLLSLIVMSRQKGQYAHIQLMKNGKEIGRAFAGSDAANWLQTGAAIKLTHLDVDDEVYAREWSGYTGHLYGDSWSSFAGGLI